MLSSVTLNFHVTKIVMKFRFSIVRVVISVSNITSHQDCLCHYGHNYFTVPGGHLIVPGGCLMILGGYLMVSGGYIMVPGGYLNKGVILSCSGQLKMVHMRRMFDRIYCRMGIRQLRGLIVLGTDWPPNPVGSPTICSLKQIFLTTKYMIIYIIIWQ